MQLKIIKNAFGRSMIEMLAVLAIIGILSIGGLWGYRFAMNHYNANKIVNDVGVFGTTIKNRDKRYAINADIPNGEFDQAKQIANTVTAKQTAAKEFQIFVDGVDKDVCKMVLSKGSGICKENSLCSKLGVVNDDSVSFYNGSNDNICGSRNKMAFAFDSARAISVKDDDDDAFVSGFGDDDGDDSGDNIGDDSGDDAQKSCGECEIKSGDGCESKSGYAKNAAGEDICCVNGKTENVNYIIKKQETNGDGNKIINCVKCDGTAFRSSADCCNNDGTNRKWVCTDEGTETACCKSCAGGHWYGVSEGSERTGWRCCPDDKWADVGTDGKGQCCNEEGQHVSNGHCCMEGFEWNGTNCALPCNSCQKTVDGACVNKTVDEVEDEACCTSLYSTTHEWFDGKCVQKCDGHRWVHKINGKDVLKCCPNDKWAEHGYPGTTGGKATCCVPENPMTYSMWNRIPVIQDGYCCNLSNREIAKVCCEAVGLQWAENEENGKRCCEEGQIVSEGHCCQEGFEWNGTNCALPCPAERLIAETGECCAEGTKAINGVCCASDTDSEVCCAGMHAAEGEYTLRTNSTYKFCVPKCGECKKFQYTSFTTEARAKVCVPDPTQSETCCVNAGRQWASDEEEGSQCCNSGVVAAGNRCYTNVKKCSDLTKAERVRGVICVGETFCDLFGNPNDPGPKRQELVNNAKVYGTGSGRFCGDKHHFNVGYALNDYSCKEYGGHLLSSENVSIPSTNDSNICRNKRYKLTGNTNNACITGVCNGRNCRAYQFKQKKWGGYGKTNPVSDEKRHRRDMAALCIID